MTADVACHLPAAGRVANVDYIPQIQLFDQFRQVISIGIHVISGPRLAGAPMAPPVMRDAAVTAIREEEHLIVPRVRTERPSMTEDYWLACAPVLVINLCAVTC